MVVPGLLGRCEILDAARYCFGAVVVVSNFIGADVRWCRSSVVPERLMR